MTDLFKPRQMGQLILTHYRELIREPGVLFWGIAFPILMALGLGVAFTKKADVVRRVVFIEAEGEAGLEALIRQFAEPAEPGKNGPTIYRIVLRERNLGNTTFLFEKVPWQQAMILLKRGSVSVVLAGTAGRPEYHFDPLNPDAQLTFLKLSKILDDEKGAGQKDRGQIVPLSAVGSRYIDFLVPGLMAMGIMMSSLWGISYGVIEKRGRKLLRRMIATPMRRSHFLISLMAVRGAMNFVESALLFLFAHFAFGITIQGDPLALLILFAAGNFAFAGIAVFISCRTANTEIGNGLISAATMPMMVLSGVFFSYHNFPEWSLPVIRNLPLTLLADGMRSVFIEGAGFAEVGFPTLVLAAIGACLFLAGLKAFRWH